MDTLAESELADRFAIFAAGERSRNELEYEEYFSVTTEKAKRSPRGTFLAAPPRNPGSAWLEERQDSRHTQRYFKSFYESFARAETAAWEEQQRTIFAAEADFRRELMYQERVEWAALCRGFARELGVYQPALLFVNALEVEQAEVVERRVRMSDYYEMLLQGCVAQEKLVRRHMILAEEPAARSSLQATEVPSWIEARRLQVDREGKAEVAEAEEERRLRISYFRWRQQQLFQMFLLEQSESQVRQTLERRERLEAGAIAGQYSNSFRSARYAQLRYEDTRRALDACTSRDITTMEATARSDLLREQHHCFRCLGALEVRAYLTTSRRQLENESMERM